MIKLTHLIFSFLTFAAIGVAGPAYGSECPTFPDVSWWSNATHEDAARYVKAKYDGNWTPYMIKWEKQLKIATRVYNDQGSMRTNTDVKLEGELLGWYIQQVLKRVDVIKCLRKENKQFQEDDGKDLTMFTTAAGPIATTVQISTVTSAGLNLNISASCANGASVFEIQNMADDWPGNATLRVYQTKGMKIVDKNQLTLANGQTTTIKVEPGKAWGRVGLWVKPSWISREIKYDAVATCS